MLKKECATISGKYVHPLRITNGQGFHLKDIDPADTCSGKMEKGEVAELLSQGTASRTAPVWPVLLGRNACYFAA